jgi:lysophospholipase L1-like esterase
VRSVSTKPVFFVALGDSLTEGLGAESSESGFVHQLFHRLRRTEQCEIHNLGVSGTRSSELCRLVDEPDISRLLTRATHISITTGGCDFIAMYEEGPISVRRIVQTVRAVRKHVKELLMKIRTLNSESELLLLGFYVPLPAYELGLKKAVWVIRMMNRIYQDLCHQFEAKLIDPFSAFFHRPDFFSDEVHPSQKGHNVLTELFIRALVSSLQPVKNSH